MSEEPGHNPDLGPWQDKDGIRLAVQKAHRKKQAIRGTLFLKVKGSEEVFTTEDVKLVPRNFKRFLSDAEEMCPDGQDTIQDADLLPVLNDLKNRSKAKVNEQVRSENPEAASPEPLDEKYSGERIERAEKLLEDEQILCKVKSVLDHKIAGEDRTKLSLFLQMLSKDTDNPLMIFGIQKQGEGKSFIAKNVIDLFPGSQVKKVTKMTKAALYRSAERDPQRFDGKIVFFGEIPESDDERKIFQIFRQLVSEGEVTKELVIEENGEYQVKELKLEGAPCLITTTTNPNLIDEQDRSRGVTYSPDISDEQNQRVREFQKSQKKFPGEVNKPPEIQKIEEDLTAALDKVSRQDFEVLNPFVEDLDSMIPDESPNIRRDFNKILQIVAELPALLQYRNRKQVETESKNQIVASYKDVFRGLAIQRKTIQNMLEGRSESVIDAYEVISNNVEANPNDYEGMKQIVQSDTRLDLENLDVFTIKDLKQWMDIEYDPAAQILRELDRMELVYKDNTTRPHHHFLVDQQPDNDKIGVKRVKKTLERVVEGQKAEEWLEDFFDRTGEDVRGEVSPETDLVPTIGDHIVEVKTGLETDDTLPLPEYRRGQKNKSEGISTILVDETGSIVFWDAETRLSST